MTTIFKKYSSIENHYQQAFIDKVILTQGVDETDWIACEKVHGANFSFIVTRSHELDMSEDQELSVNVAKRTCMLDDNDCFYPEATLEVKRKYTSAAKKVFQVLHQDFASIRGQVYRVHIFGELFGGKYSKNASPDRLPIQRGVYYCDEFEFYAFDVHVLYKPLPSSSSSSSSAYGGNVVRGNSGAAWLPFDEATDLFARAGFHIHAKPLARGTLGQMLDFDMCFDTKIPQMFFPRLEPMKPQTNICEGIIIRPASKTLYLMTGDRIIIKKKNSHFSEVRPMPKTKNKDRQDHKPSLSTEGASAWEKVQLYITIQRLHNCESKHGQLSRANQGKLAGMLAKDALEDFIKDNQALWQSVKKEDKKRISKYVSTCAVNLVSAQISS